MTGPVVEALPRAGLRVLVVDDNQDLAEVIAEFLNESGCEARLATTGALGLELVAAFRPEALLLDLGLPDITGFEFVERLRQNGSADRQIIIAVSGYGSDEAKRRSRELGFQHHLVKPVDFESVLSLLGHLFPSDGASARS